MMMMMMILQLIKKKRQKQLLSDVIFYGSPGPLTLICGMGGGGVPFSLLTALLHFRTGIRLSPCDLHASILWKWKGGGCLNFEREFPRFSFFFFSDSP